MTPWSKVAQLDASHFDDQHGLCRGQPPAARRPEAAHLPHPRWRRHVEGDGPRPARWPRERRPRGPGAQGPALRRHGARRVRLASTMATTGSRCASTCPRLRSATWWCTMTMSWSARTAAASGFSTTSRRCGNSRAEIANAGAHLFAPRVDLPLPRNTNTDTPLPPEEPAGQNPPDGAILYYNLQIAGRRSARHPGHQRQSPRAFREHGPAAPPSTRCSTCRPTGCVLSQRPQRPRACIASSGTCTPRRNRTPNRKKFLSPPSCMIHRCCRANGSARRVHSEADRRRPNVRAEAGRESRPARVRSSPTVREAG